MFVQALPFPVIGTLPPALVVAGAAVLAGLAGALLARWFPAAGRVLRVLANLTLVGVLLVTALRLVRLDPAFDDLLPRFGMPAQQVVGGETRVPLSSDGHYWIVATIDGASQRFMVDTGATISAISSEAAREAGASPDPLRLPVLVQTANGATTARLARLGELRLGNVTARDLDVIVTGESGGLNVLGMNFLSRLKSWRVEDGVLILIPRAG